MASLRDELRLEDGSLTGSRHSALDKHIWRQATNPKSNTAIANTFTHDATEEPATVKAMVRMFPGGQSGRHERTVTVVTTVEEVRPTRTMVVQYEEEPLCEQQG